MVERQWEKETWKSEFALLYTDLVTSRAFVAETHDDELEGMVDSVHVVPHVVIIDVVFVNLEQSVRVPTRETNQKIFKK